MDSQPLEGEYKDTGGAGDQPKNWRATNSTFATVSHDDSQPGKGEYKNTGGELQIRELVCGLPAIIGGV